MDTPVDELYDDIVYLTSQLCQTPIAVINFIDEQRQWFKAEIGLGVRETPLENSLCAHLRADSQVLVVPDTLRDPRFATNPLCVAGPNHRSYAGVPLRSPDGYILGTLCVLDHQPRAFGETEQRALRTMAKQVITLLELKRSLELSHECEELALSAIEGNSDSVQVLDLDARILSINGSGLRLMEFDDSTECVQRNWLDWWADSDREAAVHALDAAKRGNRGEFQGSCSSFRGALKSWEVIVTPILNEERKASRLLAVCRDITERLRTEAQLRETSKLESLGVMAGGIAHDFNNLLTCIMGNASLLRDAADPEHEPFALEVIDSAKRAADLTQQMLAYSGRANFQIVDLDLSQEVAQILKVDSDDD